MSTIANAISVEEYFREHAREGLFEYVDGRLVERHVGRFEHAKLQKRLMYLLDRSSMPCWSVPELHVEVAPGRYRIADVCLGLGAEPGPGILTSPPFLVIEILSPSDLAEDMQERIDDYLSFGVSCVWVINPRNRRGYVHTRDGMKEAQDGVLRTSNPQIEVPLAKLFD